MPDQLALVDVAAYTVAAPDAAVKAQVEADGLTPAARLKVFEAATIKQIVTYWSALDYRDMVLRLERAALAFGTDTHTDTVRRLMEFWEVHGGRHAP